MAGTNRMDLYQCLVYISVSHNAAPVRSLSPTGSHGGGAAADEQDLGEFFAGRSAEARQATGPAPRAFVDHADQSVTRSFAKQSSSHFVNPTSPFRA